MFLRVDFRRYFADMVGRNYSALALNMATGTTAFTQANVFNVNAGKQPLATQHVR
jgi:hypothetical protein